MFDKIGARPPRGRVLHILLMGTEKNTRLNATLADALLGKCCHDASDLNSANAESEYK